MNKFILPAILYLFVFSMNAGAKSNDFFSYKNAYNTLENNRLYSGKINIKNALLILEYGRVASSFRYVNSEGEKLDNLLGSTNNHLAIGGKIPIKRTSAYLVSTLSYSTYGASGSDSQVGNYYDWKVNYLGTHIGVGYEFLRFHGYRNSANISLHQGFTFFTQISFSSEFLIQGTQTLNNQVYDLRGVEQFDKPFLFARGGIGVIYYASKALSVYAKYAGGMGFSVFKSSIDDQENLDFLTHTIGLGLQISLPSSK